MKKYYLEIYGGSIGSDVLVSFESDTPFININKGDFLNTAFLDKDNPPDRIEVVDVEHILWDHEDGTGPKQKVCIYTKSK